MTKAVRDGAVRQFGTYDDALRFVLREADHFRLWSIDGEFARQMRERAAADASRAFGLAS